MSLLWLEGGDGTAETAMKQVEQALAAEQHAAIPLPTPPDAPAPPQPPASRASRLLGRGPLRMLATLVRMIEDQLRTSRQVLRRVQALESADPTPRLTANEHQLEQLAREQRELHRRLAELERRR